MSGPVGAVAWRYLDDRRVWDFMLVGMYVVRALNTIGDDRWELFMNRTATPEEQTAWAVEMSATCDMLGARLAVPPVSGTITAEGFDLLCQGLGKNRGVLAGHPALRVLQGALEQGARI